jgi:hypothetical protein
MLIFSLSQILTTWKYSNLGHLVLTRELVHYALLF